MYQMTQNLFRALMMARDLYQWRARKECTREEILSMISSVVFSKYYCSSRFGVAAAMCRALVIMMALYLAEFLMVDDAMASSTSCDGATERRWRENAACSMQPTHRPNSNMILVTTIKELYHHMTCQGRVSMHSPTHMIRAERSVSALRS